MYRPHRFIFTQSSLAISYIVKYQDIKVTSNIGKVIQKNQVDVTIIYFSIRSPQHVLGNLLPIIRGVRVRFLQHMVTCCCGGQGVGEQQCGSM